MNIDNFAVDEISSLIKQLKQLRDILMKANELQHMKHLAEKRRQTLEQHRRDYERNSQQQQQQQQRGINSNPDDDEAEDECC